MGMTSIYPSGNSNVPATGATNYCPASTGGGGSWTATETQDRNVIAVAGTIDYWRISLATAPGTGKSWAFTMMKNGSTTGLTITISDTNTTGHDSVNTISVSPSDTISVQCTPSGTPAAMTDIRWAWRFTGNNANEGLLLRGSTGTLTANATRYTPVMFDAGLGGATEAAQASILPTAGTISALYVDMDGTPGGTDTVTLTLMKNGSTTGLTCTVASAATTASDLINSVSVSPGDTISWQIVATATAAARRVRVGAKWSPTTDGESLFLRPNVTQTLATNTTSYVTGITSWNATEANRSMLLIACTIKSMYLTMTDFTNAGTFTGTVDVDASSSGVTTSVTGTGGAGQLTNHDTTHTAAVNDDQLITWKGVTVSSGNVQPTMSCVLLLAQASTGQPTMRRFGLLALGRYSPIRLQGVRTF